MDEVIFEEFKGTGNSEIILDRKVADKRTFPSMDITRSGTRKEELLVAPDQLKKMYILRRILNPMGTMDAIDFLLDKLRNTKSNTNYWNWMKKPGREHGARRGRGGGCGRAPGAAGERQDALLRPADRLAWHRLHVRLDPGAEKRRSAEPGAARLEGGTRDGGVEEAARSDARWWRVRVPVAAGPYRCPPGPYERVSQIADYFKKAKPRSKIILLDGNPDIVSKKGLFLAAWNGMYKGMIDYRPNSELADVDVKGMTVKLTFDSVKGDVLNVVPPHGAGSIARQAGLITANQRWCGVDWLTMESVAVKGMHVLGDATLSAPAMPKSGSMANQQAKVCAAAVIALLKGEPVNQRPVMMNTCYSFVDSRNAVHVASVHQYDAAQKVTLAVKGAGGLSDKANELEGTYAWGWARNMWGDALG